MLKLGEGRKKKKVQGNDKEVVLVVKTRQSDWPEIQKQLDAASSEISHFEKDIMIKATVPPSYWKFGNDKLEVTGTLLDTIKKE